MLPELRIVRRNYAARLWEMLEQPPMDAEPVIFAGRLCAQEIPSSSRHGLLHEVRRQEREEVEGEGGPA